MIVRGRNDRQPARPTRAPDQAHARSDQARTGAPCWLVAEELEPEPDHADKHDQDNHKLGWVIDIRKTTGTTTAGEHQSAPVLDSPIHGVQEKRTIDGVPRVTLALEGRDNPRSRIIFGTVRTLARCVR
jgi:hypothetical protein